MAQYLHEVGKATDAMIDYVCDRMMTWIFWGMVASCGLCEVLVLCDFIERCYYIHKSGVGSYFRAWWISALFGITVFVFHALMYGVMVLANYLQEKTYK